MKKILIVFLAVISLNTWAQEKITTFILVRHAEKDLTQSTNDPDLSAAGIVRAKNLVEVFKKTSIDAVYSTEFKRTRQTVEPLAQSHSLPVRTYMSTVKEDIDMMLKNHAGQTFVVCGHSNTIPNLVNYLTGEENYRPFEDGDYGNIIIVSVTQRGKNAKVVWLKY